jgi:hypothetical protein
VPLVGLFADRPEQLPMQPAVVVVVAAAVVVVAAAEVALVDEFGLAAVFEVAGVVVVQLVPELAVLEAISVIIQQGVKT